jgi:hypothetical protein
MLFEEAATFILKPVNYPVNYPKRSTFSIGGLKAIHMPADRNRQNGTNKPHFNHYLPSGGTG